ncbi:nitroreductase family protein [Paenibacillus contaminans]|uniref:Nitroreductase n=1 Tax=Paenibacillus contaminans TaxID=450362 RepID=A0A329MNX3_9BACL|nr:nitroreductase [Paenibacillus contaminans]RAV21599.1 nitroreductase [Paenibacillus contaminans]
MSISEVIRNRRTIRSFNDKPLAESTILELLNDAVWAPNHGLREPWRFIGASVRESKEKLADWVIEALSERKRYKWIPGKIKNVYKEKIVQIPAILFVVVKEEKNKLKLDEDFAAACALIQNLQLLGWEQGIGMIWSIDDTLCGNLSFGTKIGIRSDERIAGMLYMGYFDQAPKPRARTTAERKMSWL